MSYLDQPRQSAGTPGAGEWRERVRIADTVDLRIELDRIDEQTRELRAVLAARERLDDAVRRLRNGAHWDIEERLANGEEMGWQIGTDPYTGRLRPVWVGAAEWDDISIEGDFLYGTADEAEVAIARLRHAEEMDLIRTAGEHRHNPRVHYRLYDAGDGVITIACMQDFDYWDYDEDTTRFISTEAWSDESEAEEVLAMLRRHGRL